MSWQATAWAAKQATGSAGNKLTLLALANYADSSGVCWPTQDTLAANTEQSIDTVQRRLKRLVALKLVRVEKREANRGQWPGKIYHLNISVAEKTKPQSAAPPQPSQTPPPAADHAAPERVTMPPQARPPYRTAVRHKPSIEQLIEPPVMNNARASAGERLQAFQGKHEGDEVVQNRIAQRLGKEGWEVLGLLTDAQRAKLTNLERRGELTDERLAAAALDARSPQPRSHGDKV